MIVRSQKQPMPSRRILVVEDDPDLRRFLVDALGDEGYDIHGAASGAEALTLLHGWTPDLILLDISMPEMDGREFRASQLRLPFPASRTPVVLVTGVHDYTGLVEELHAAAILRKPFDLDALFRMVEEVPSADHRPEDA